MDDGSALYRRPVFDIEVRAERRNPLNRAERNALLMELYRAGLFEPANRATAEGLLAELDLDGTDLLRLLKGQGAPVSGEVRS